MYDQVWTEAFLVFLVTPPPLKFVFCSLCIRWRCLFDSPVVEINCVPLSMAYLLMFRSTNSQCLVKTSKSWYGTLHYYSIGIGCLIGVIKIVLNRPLFVFLKHHLIWCFQGYFYHLMVNPYSNSINFEDFYVTMFNLSVELTLLHFALSKWYS